MVLLVGLAAAEASGKPGTQAAGQLLGKVHDHETLTPIESAKVEIAGTDMCASTDEKGMFLVIGILPGRYTVTASAIGYEPVYRTIAVVPDSTSHEDFALMMHPTENLGQIRGRVTDAYNAEGIAGAAVEVEGTELGATTDEDGRFLIRAVRSGLHNVNLSAVGYAPTSESVTVVPDSTVSLNAKLATTVIQIGPHPKWAPPPTLIYLSQTHTLRNVIHDATPVLWNSPRLPDLLKREAGVVYDPVRDELHVRGGPANELEIQLDDALIEDPIFRSFDALPRPIRVGINGVELVSGGGYADGHASGPDAVRIYTRTGSEPATGRFGYSTEALFPKQDHSLGLNRLEGAVGSSNLDDRLTYFLTGEGLGVSADSQEPWQVPANRFEGSAQCKLDCRPRGSLADGNWAKVVADGQVSKRRWTKHGQLTLAGLGSVSSDTTVRLSDSRGDLGMFWLPNNALMLELTGGYSDNQFFSSPKDVTDDDFLSRSAGTGHVRGEFTWADKTRITGLFHCLTGGFDLRAYHLGLERELTVPDSVPRREQWSADPVVGDLFLGEDLESDNIVCRPGLRLEYVNAQAPDGETTAARPHARLAPRLGVAIPLSYRTGLRFSYDHYYHAPQFNCYYANPGGTVPGVPQGYPELRPGHTVEYEAGFTWEPCYRWAYDFSAYYRDMTDLVARVATADSAGSAYANVGSASAAGLEITLETYDWNPWYARVNYSLSAAQGNVSHVDDMFDSMQAPRTWLDYDRRHTLNVDLGFHPRDDIRPGVLAGFRADLLMSCGSGLPYTPLDANGMPTAAKNSQRLPGFFSADVHLSKRFQIRSFKLGLLCDISNVLDSREVVGVYPSADAQVCGGSGRIYDQACYWDYRLGDWQFHPAQDENHDGYVTRQESRRYAAAAVSEFNVARLYYAPGRRVQLGISLEF